MMVLFMISVTSGWFFAFSSINYRKYAAIMLGDFAEMGANRGVLSTFR